MNLSYDEETGVLLVPTGRYYGASFLSKYDGLKVVASNTTGDSHINTAWCAHNGVKVITLKRNPVLQRITAVAELTIGLIIALTRNVLPAVRSVKRGEWNRYPFGGKKMLSQMTLGIIGMGRIGNHVNNRAKNLFGHILTYDKHMDPEDDLSELLMESDVVTLHIPIEDNIGFFDVEDFNIMKSGAYFINTSRGEVVVEDALIDALDNHLGGAAIDVLSGEFDADFNCETNQLVEYARTHDNLIITPHIGGSTKDAWAMTEEAILENIRDYTSQSGK